MGHSHAHGHHGHSHGLQGHAVAEGAPYARLMRLASYASVAVATVLLSAKLIAWWRTDSLAMLSSFTDSVFDVVTSIINMLAIRYALKPADDDHRFGHTSIEDIAGLAQFVFISASMALIVLQSIERLANPQPLLHESIGISVSFAALLLTTVLVVFQTYVARKSRSLVIAADRLHYVSDIAFNLAVMGAFALSKYFGFIWADPVMAILIAIAILWHSKEIGIRAFNNLMDHEMPEADKAAITEIVGRFPAVHNVHKLKTRYSGAKPFIQMHVEIAGDLSFREAHDITDQLEKALMDAYPGAEIIIHPDPLSA